MSETLLKINSTLILKKIFSHLYYDLLLKVVKDNRELQKRLDLNIDNYKQRTLYEYIETEKASGVNGARLYLSDVSPYSKIFTVTLFIILLLYSILLIFFPFGNLDENDFSDKNIKHYFRVIRRMNLSLFGLLAYIIVSYFVLSFWIIQGYSTESGLKLKIKKCAIIVTALFYLVYDIIIMVKLSLSYKITKKVDQIIMFTVIGDYLVIIFIFLYFSGLVLIIYLYFRDAGKNIRINKENILKTFRDIKINDFKLPVNFTKKNEYQKIQYILQTKCRYEISISQNQKYLISLINSYRKSKKISELNYDKEIGFDDLIFDNYSEPILFNKKNIFKCPNKNYLFKFPINEFKKKFINKDKKIIQILSYNYLKKIIIIEKDNNEYIFLFKAKNNYSRNNNFNNYDDTQTDRISFTEKGPIIHFKNNKSHK